MLRYILLFPLLGTLLNGCLPLFGVRLKRQHSVFIACLASVCTALWSLRLLVTLAYLPAGHQVIEDVLYNWMQVGSVRIQFSLYADVLGVGAAVLLSLVALLIHVYSVGYMARDEGYARYFALLNALLFSMMMVLFAGNVLVGMFGWMWVGLCIVLLMSFWYVDVERVKVGSKALALFRLGDVALLFALVLLYWNVHTLDWSVLRRVGDSSLLPGLLAPWLWGMSKMDWIGVCLAIGVLCRTAQLPFYMWLPDSTAGPAPAVAWIHSAILPLLGVFWLARFHFLLKFSSVASGLLIVFGALTSLLVMAIAIFQYDVKHTLAYIAMSQVGLMVVGIGVGVPDAVIFHVFSFVCYMTALSLAGGAVLMGMHYVQDIRVMGGLVHSMPWTHWGFLLAVFAGIGFPGFSGFFSGHSLLWRSLERGYTAVWLVGAMTMVLHAFCLVRLLCLIFYDTLRGGEQLRRHLPEGQPKEVPWTMRIPMYVLLLASLVVGAMHVPTFFGGKALLGHWLHGGFIGTKVTTETILTREFSTGVVFVGVFVGALLALLTFGQGAVQALRNEALLQVNGRGGAAGVFFRWAQRRFYIDVFLELVTVKLLLQVVRFVLAPIEKYVIEGALRLLSATILGVGVMFGLEKREPPGRAISIAVFVLVLCLLWWMLSNAMIVEGMGGV